MQFKIIEKYINGYIKVEIEGYYIERFINTCKKEGISLWGLDRKKRRANTSKNRRSGLQKSIRDRKGAWM